MKQVLIINITRLGDLVQTGPLIARLRRDAPDVAVDLVVDAAFAPMAALLGGVRAVIAGEFQRLWTDAQTRRRSVVALVADLAAWTRPLTEARYDRVINLTFSRASALLTAAIGGAEVRGATAAPDGTIVIRGEWMRYLANLAHYRPFNRFNLVDLYALGGSGPGPFTPLALTVPETARETVRRWMAAEAAGTARARPAGSPGAGRVWIAVHVGASEPTKAWTPEGFGLTIAALARRAPDLGFVLIGTAGEAAAARAALEAACGGTGGPLARRPLILNAVGRTSLPEVLAVLAQCRLVLTNDTGPMHLAVALGTPVVNLSVGPVDFRETGPYGPGHVVIQADLACAPCAFQHWCASPACKARIRPEEVAAWCLHRLGRAPAPEWSSGVRVYESGIDEDGLGTFRWRAGVEDPLVAWYGTWWRRFWYADFTGRPSRTPGPTTPPPDWEAARAALAALQAAAPRVVRGAKQVARLAGRTPIPVQALHAHQARVAQDTQALARMGLAAPITRPVTVLWQQQLLDIDAPDLPAMAWQQARACRHWARRISALASACAPWTFPTPTPKEWRYAHQA